MKRDGIRGIHIIQYSRNSTDDAVNMRTNGSVGCEGILVPERGLFAFRGGLIPLSDMLHKRIFGGLRGSVGNFCREHEEG